jgi:diadenosine tetraphosphatase ApaH/serine/threonine PP2A family protein phosphatase
LIQDSGSSSAAWTHEQLSPEHFKFLDNAPLTVQHGSILFTHASARNPDKWDYVDSEVKAQLCLDVALSAHQANHVFVGHVHHQHVYYPGASGKLMRFTPTPGVALPAPARRDMVVTIGSVGQPRDKDTRAMYALYDTEAQKLCFYRVVYDHHAAALAIRHAGLPEHLAHRIETGT